MPGPMLTQSDTVMCSHAGTATPAVPFPRVQVGGAAIVTTSCQYTVAGCALSSVPSPPCVTAMWTVGATRVTAGGTPVALSSGVSTATPTGQPLLVTVPQQRVTAT
jgi:hypothetical protein